ncbi:hypothetical protein, partial [Neptunomonas sp.]|uniref:hypothetical protein n=1 Tax=Neptunomonas sp. TaxID=1971898 RepID=UPI0025DD7D2E
MKKKLFTYLCSIMLLSFFSISSVFAENTDARTTYAVVWSIDTNNAELFNNTIAAHSTEVLELWKNGTIENVYIDSMKTHDVVSKGDTARVMFFIKAKTDEEAKKILNGMPLVK